MTLWQLVGRVVREAVERHDPARPPRGRRTGSRAAAGGTDETSAPKVALGPDAAPAGESGNVGAGGRLRAGRPGDDAGRACVTLTGNRRVG